MAYRNYKPSRAAARAYAEKMTEIEVFCIDNHIISSSTLDSFYFSINDQKYRVSNHSVESSRYNSHGKYHTDGRQDDTIYIHASKTRLIEIYNNLKSGKQLDGHGNIVFTHSIPG